jgi:hypothetical protein
VNCRQIGSRFFALLARRQANNFFNHYFDHSSSLNSDLQRYVICLQCYTTITVSGSLSFRTQRREESRSTRHAPAFDRRTLRAKRVIQYCLGSPFKESRLSPIGKYHANIVQNTMKKTWMMIVESRGTKKVFNFPNLQIWEDID